NATVGNETAKGGETDGLFILAPEQRFFAAAVFLKGVAVKRQGRRGGRGGGAVRILHHAHQSVAPGPGWARMTRAGVPATTAPAPIKAPSPILTPARMVALLPMAARRPTRVGTQTQSWPLCRAPVAVTADGKRSLVNITP